MRLGYTLQDMLYELEGNQLARKMLYGSTRISPPMGDYFDYNVGTGMMSFLPKAKASGLTANDDPFTSTLRQKAKIGRITRQIFDATEYKPTDIEIEEFSHLLRSLDSTLWGEFRIVSGEAIRSAYLGDNYEPRQGSLNNSCMQYDYCQDYLEVYVQNPEQVQLLILEHKDNKTIMGRALVWQSNHGTIMDRIYGSTSTQVLFEKYAEKEGWWFKASERSQEFLKNTNAQSVTVLDAFVELPNHLHALYPYMDTFFHYDAKEGRFYAQGGHRYDVYLHGTEGDDHSGLADIVREHFEFECEHCGEWWPIADFETCPNCQFCETCEQWYDGSFRQTCPRCTPQTPRATLTYSSNGTFHVNFVYQLLDHYRAFIDDAPFVLRH